MQYPAHDAFVAPARLRPQLWRVCVGLLLISLVYGLVIVVIFGGLIATSGWEGAERWKALMATAGTPTSTLLVLATFIGMGLGPLLAARLVHGRTFASVFGQRSRAVRDFFIAGAICGAIYALLSLIPSDPAPTANLDVALWVSFLPLALFGILIQTGAEEVLFRGYLQQQLAARFASPLMWMVLPSAVFAVLHYQPQVMGDDAWVVVAAVFLFAIFAADLTAKTGSIGASWGFHFANNSVAILFVSMEGPLSGLALFTMPADALQTGALRPLLYVDMVLTTITWAVIRFTVARR